MMSYDVHFTTFSHKSIRFVEETEGLDYSGFTWTWLDLAVPFLRDNIFKHFTTITFELVPNMVLVVLHNDPTQN